MATLFVTESIIIHESELEEDFIRASGPGGQNVNKVSSAVKLRFNVRGTSSLPLDVKERLIKIAGHRINSQGILVIDARRFRSQERNRIDARNRLIELIRRAARKPKIRRKTSPTKSSVEKRLNRKKKRGEKKNLRRKIISTED